MKNVIYEDDSLIGTKDNIWKYFKEEIVLQIQDNTLGFEDVKSNINNMLQVMNEIQENENIYGNTLLKIRLNAFGDFYYKILEEVE